MSLHPLTALVAVLCLTAAAGPARGQTGASPATPAALTEDALGDQRGGLATAAGMDIGFGASMRTYVDGTLAMETRLTWTPTGAHTERVFESDAATSLPGGLGTATPVLLAPGVSVIHDLGDNRIASVILNTANDRTIRQDTDITLHLPQLPDLQQRIAAERLARGLQDASPLAAGLGR